MDADLVNRLTTAIAGLTWLSESDYPWAIVDWPDRSFAELTPTRLLEWTHHSSETPIAQTEIDTFFAPATQTQDWYGEDERATLQRYQALVQLLKTQFQNLQVYQIGEIELYIYILGQTPTGTIGGITTKAIET